MWAGLIAIADQGRAVIGKGSLDGPTQTSGDLLAQMDGDFHDITSGFNGNYAGRGDDLVMGRGSPIAFNVVRDLMQVGGGVSSTANAASAKSSGTNLSGGMTAASTSVAALFTPAATPAGVPTAASRAVQRRESPRRRRPPSRCSWTRSRPTASPAGRDHDLALNALQQDDFDFSGLLELPEDLRWLRTARPGRR